FPPAKGHCRRPVSESQPTAGAPGCRCIQRRSRKRLQSTKMSEAKMLAWRPPTPKGGEKRMLERQTHLPSGVNLGRVSRAKQEVRGRRWKPAGQGLTRLRASLPPSVVESRKDDVSRSAPFDFELSTFDFPEGTRSIIRFPRCGSNPRN